MRGVAQFGSALDWGSRGRWFKSSRPELMRRLQFPARMVTYIHRKGLRYQPASSKCYVHYLVLCVAEMQRIVL